MLDLLVCSINHIFGSKCILKHIFIVVRNRQQMFLSGFIQDMTRIGSLLPGGVYVWMLDECIIQSFSSFTDSHSLYNSQYVWKLGRILHMHISKCYVPYLGKRLGKL